MFPTILILFGGKYIDLIFNDKLMTIMQPYILWFKALPLSNPALFYWCECNS